MTFTNEEINGLRLDMNDAWIETDFPRCNVCVFPGKLIIDRLLRWFNISIKEYSEGDGYFDCYVEIDALRRKVKLMDFVWCGDDFKELPIAITNKIEEKSIFDAILASAADGSFEEFLNEIIED